MSDRMREFITTILPSEEWVTIWSWRLGVFLVLFLTTPLAMVGVQNEIAQTDPMVAQTISTVLQCGFVLIAFGIALPATAWAAKKVRGVEG